MVEPRVMPFTYLPLAAEGLARITLVITVSALSTSFCDGKESLPTGTCTSAVLSVRNSILPALISLTAAVTSEVTVPVFGLGIRPRGPSTLPRRPTERIMSGVAIRASKSVQLSFWIFSTSSSPPTMSAPAASASFRRSPEVITATFLVLPRPCGSTTVPRTIWSACLGSTPRRSVTSTVSSNLANFTFCKRGTASVSVYWRFSPAARALSMFFPDLRLIHFSLSPTASQNFCGPWCCRWKQLAIGYRSTEYPDAYCLLLLPGCLRRPKPIWILWQSWQFRRSLPANCHLLVANCYG